jgi:hypothetical protein
MVEYLTLSATLDVVPHGGQPNSEHQEQDAVN